MSYVRCRNCRKRRTLAMHPDKYYRMPRCLMCCKREFKGWYVDKYRLTVERGPKAPKACNCYGYSFPHRLHSKFCTKNPNLTAEMLQQREKDGNWS